MGTQSGIMTFDVKLTRRDVLPRNSTAFYSRNLASLRLRASTSKVAATLGRVSLHICTAFFKALDLIPYPPTSNGEIMEQLQKTLQVILEGRNIHSLSCFLLPT